MRTVQEPSEIFILNQIAQLLSNLIGIRLHLKLNSFYFGAGHFGDMDDSVWMSLCITWKKLQGQTTLLFKRRDLSYVFPHFSDSTDQRQMEFVILMKRYLQSLASHLSFFSSEHWEIEDVEVNNMYEIMKEVNHENIICKSIQIQMASDLIIEGYFVIDVPLFETWQNTLKKQHVVELESLAIVNQHRTVLTDSEDASLALQSAFGRIMLNPDQMRDLQPYAILPFHAEINGQVFLFYNHHKIAEGKIMEWGDPIQIQVISITENGNKILSHWQNA